MKNNVYNILKNLDTAKYTNQDVTSNENTIRSLISPTLLQWLSDDSGNAQTLKLNVDFDYTSDNYRYFFEFIAGLFTSFYGRNNSSAFSSNVVVFNIYQSLDYSNNLQYDDVFYTFSTPLGVHLDCPQDSTYYLQIDVFFAVDPDNRWPDSPTAQQMLDSGGRIRGTVEIYLKGNAGE